MGEAAERLRQAGRELGQAQAGQLQAAQLQAQGVVITEGHGSVTGSDQKQARARSVSGAKAGSSHSGWPAPGAAAAAGMDYVALAGVMSSLQLCSCTGQTCHVADHSTLRGEGQLHSCTDGACLCLTPPPHLAQAFQKLWEPVPQTPCGSSSNSRA